MIGSLVGHYRAADANTRAAGRAWYPRARATAAGIGERTGVPLETAAGVLAAVSPRISWGYALRAAETLIGAYAAGRRAPYGLTLGRSERAAESILEGTAAILNGRKVESFRRNILGDVDVVTVDVWAARAAGWTAAVAPAYDRLAAAYVAAADACGEVPAEFQAIIWCQVRERIW